MKPKVALPPSNPCRFLQLSPHRYFTDSSHLGLSSVPPLCPCQSTGTTPAAIPAFCGYMSSSLDTHCWCSPPCTHWRPAPPVGLCMLPASTTVCTLRGDCVATRKHTRAKAATTAGGLKLGPVFCHWPAPLCSLQLATPLQPCTSKPPARPVICLHCCTHGMIDQTENLNSLITI